LGEELLYTREQAEGKFVLLRDLFKLASPGWGSETMLRLYQERRCYIHPSWEIPGIRVYFPGAVREVRGYDDDEDPTYEPVSYSFDI
jgi:hypothetical protein